jgi:hypothetical protein
MKILISSHKIKIFLILQALILNTSCASIVSGRNQSVTVSTTTSNNTSLNNSNCKLINSKGEWITPTPGSVLIRKSYGNMSINCENASLKGSQTFKSKHEGIVWGNILLGGIIGWAVDAGTGAGFSYPQSMNVEMK